MLSSSDNCGNDTDTGGGQLIFKDSTPDIIDWVTNNQVGKQEGACASCASEYGVHGGK
jgi:hypothetical protein